MTRWDLAGKVAVVTGGAGAIGSAICKGLGQAGAKVAVVDFNSGVAAKTAGDLARAGITAVSLAVDVADEKSVRAAAADIAGRWGSLDIVVNAAGNFIRSSLLETTEEEWDRTVDTHLKGSFLWAREAAAYMIPRRFGRIINVSSEVAVTGGRYGIAYAAAKAGIIGLTRSLARSLAPHAITANALAPGTTDTPLWRGGLTEGPALEEARAAKSKGVPLGRLGDPEDFVGLVLLLSSEEGSYITGQTIHVNGGAVMA
ncbi:MAG: SDR family oxidoreductase [Firmicutes bacterium]|nr:SDR family oxidoreductase [Bacillota bacterium]